MSETKLPTTDRSLIGANIFLRPITGEDLLSIYVWGQQVNAHELHPFPQPYSSSSDFVETNKKPKPPNEAMLAIIRRKDNMLVGQISFTHYNPLNRSAELSILIDPDVHRKKFATEAMSVLLRHLFKQRGLNKVYLLVNESNRGMNEFLTHFGFKRNASLKDHYFLNGEFQEGFVYELAAFQLDR